MYTVIYVCLYIYRVCRCLVRADQYNTTLNKDAAITSEKSRGHHTTNDSFTNHKNGNSGNNASHSRVNSKPFFTSHSHQGHNNNNNASKDGHTRPRSSNSNKHPTSNKKSSQVGLLSTPLSDATPPMPVDVKASPTAVKVVMPAPTPISAMIAKHAAATATSTATNNNKRPLSASSEGSTSTNHHHNNGHNSDHKKQRDQKQRTNNNNKSYKPFSQSVLSDREGPFSS